MPEAGDEIQHIKSGLMEIAQAFVVNKADREGADTFANSLQKMVKEQHQEIPVFKTVADKNIGIDLLFNWVLADSPPNLIKTEFLLAEQVYKLIQYRRMKDIDREDILLQLKMALNTKGFNLYEFIEKYV
ncbi:membrane ATPase/protein kinase [compost metagenome]